MLAMSKENIQSDLGEHCVLIGYDDIKHLFKLQARLVHLKTMQIAYSESATGELLQEKDANAIKQTKKDIQQLLVELGLNNSEIEELKQYF